MSFPSTITGLLSLIEETFPEVTPKPGDSPEKIFFEAGQRSVVHHLRRLREQAGQPPSAPRPRGIGRPVR